SCFTCVNKFGTSLHTLIRKVNEAQRAGRPTRIESIRRWSVDLERVPAGAASSNESGAARNQFG
ncbi:MAG: hypothetical protein ACOC0O_05075, partial [Spirochaetota bacterium]